MISVIVCTVDPIKAKSTEEHYGKLLGNSPYEMLLIQNPCSMAAGYNEGIAASKGDVLIFSHDDIEFLQEDFVETIEAHLRVVDMLGVAGTSRLINGNWISTGHGWLHGQVAHPHGTGFGVCQYGTETVLAVDCMAIDGCWMCAKREVAENIRYDEVTFDGFHCYDLDFSYRAHRASYKVGVASDLFPIHYSGGTYDNNWREARRRFEAKHPDCAGYRMVTAGRRFTSRSARDKDEVLRIMQDNLTHEPAHH